jgi:hypothetical protein
VPGGAPQADAAVVHAHGANIMQALRDRNFVAFLAGNGCVTVGSMVFLGFLPLYVKERLGVASGTVMMKESPVTAAFTV